MKTIITLFDIPMHNWTLQETVGEIGQRLENRQFTQHVVVNVAKLMAMQDNAALRQAVLQCDIINIDGAGIVFGGRFLGLNIPERVAGIDLFYELLALAERRRFSVYFLGARPDIVTRAVAVLQQRYPNLIIAGFHHGYFKAAEEAEMVDQIRRSGADLLFVAMTSPLKETFIQRWRQRLGVHFVMGVGGTLDVVAGKVRRAPLWMQRWGLEWLFRLLQEPRRLWKRYLISNSRFLYRLGKARLLGANRAHG